ncbi:hypothetical protein JZ751_019483 [Albula glossodonta]|uniref:Dipeptidase n=1 Tax=Albula glossodonta TaxID=121402 RepID=A0A8T2NYA5_9TELE|nr:hypothetical protein JZ751_019483 [Albula glossodonta]
MLLKQGTMWGFSALWAMLCLHTLCYAADPNKEQALLLMRTTPLIDGHNDLPWQMRKQFNNQLSKVNLTTIQTTHTNTEKIKQGHLAAQAWTFINTFYLFWSAYVPCDTQHKDAVRQTLDQIDIIHRMYIMDAFAQKRTASLIGVEGGHSIDSSLGILRIMYQLGQVIKEMNRLGMLIDLAHVSEEVMNQVLDLSKAPIIFSHSSAYTLCQHKRNVPDAILKRLGEKGGIIMVNFYNDYVTCSQTANLSNVADHFDHIKKVAGHTIIGFGSDFDGVRRVPQGLEDVSKFPDLVAELVRRGWTDEEIKGALGDNLLRVLREVERVRDSLKNDRPDDVPIPYEQVENACRTSYGYQPLDSSGNSVSQGPLLLALAALLSWSYWTPSYSC